MARVNEIPQSIDARLVSWHKKALALEAQFDADRTSVLARIEGQKRHTSEALERAKEALDLSADLAEDVKSKILTDLDHLKLTLDLSDDWNAHTTQTHPACTGRHLSHHIKRNQRCAKI